MNSDPIVIEQTFDVPIARIWQAITTPSQMRQWFFRPMLDFCPEVGFETEFNVDCEGKNFLHQWKVTEVIPQTKIAYQWQYRGYPGDSVVSWELSETDNGTKLVLTHSGQESFEGDPIFTRENGIAGWTWFVKESLVGFLSQEPSSE